MNTDWRGGTATFDPDGPGPAPVTTFAGTFGDSDAGVDLSQAFIDVAYARRWGDRFTWGVAAVLGIQAFEATGVRTFAPYTQTFAASGGAAAPQSLSNNGHDYSTGVGYKIGFQADLSPTVAIAAAYTSRISMGKFDDYSDLFAEAGGFDIPASIKAGITVAATPTFAVSLDVEHTEFGDIESVGNPIANIFACPTVNPASTAFGNCLGGSNGAGFGWNDMTTYKLGVEWRASEAMTWRAGYSQGDQPIAESEVLFNILAPGVIEEHITAGFTRQFDSKGSRLALSFMYALEGEQSGVNPFDPTQTISFEMNQFEVELGYTWAF